MQVYLSNNTRKLSNKAMCVWHFSQISKVCNILNWSIGLGRLRERNLAFTENKNWNLDFDQDDITTVLPSWLLDTVP